MKTRKQRAAGNKRSGWSPAPIALGVVTPDGEISILPLDQGPVSLGSGDQATVRIQDPTVSRRHCMIRGLGDRVVIQDMGSTNGTRVEDQWLQGRREVRLPVALELGKLRIGLFPLAGLVGQTPVIRFGDLLTGAPAMAKVCLHALFIASAALPVLIQGESGTGKELIAAGIHRNSSRRAAPLVPVNCANLGPQLAEAQLFGVRKGAFTGAVADRPGLMFSSRGGSLFLDEISELAPQVQASLLRALEQLEARPVGGVTTRALEFRLLAATNYPLEKLVGEGRFRADLFYRLNVLRVTLPPLRTRPVDIGILAAYFASGIPDMELTQELVQGLEQHDWPGNVRELKNTLLRLSSLGPSCPQAEDLAACISPMPLVCASARQATGSTKEMLELLGIPRSTYYYQRKKEAERTS
jgi:two-component system, NtrC family, response regulator